MRKLGPAILLLSLLVIGAWISLGRQGSTTPLSIDSRPWVTTSASAEPTAALVIPAAAERDADALADRAAVGATAQPSSSIADARIDPAILRGRLIGFTGAPAVGGWLFLPFHEPQRVEAKSDAGFEIEIPIDPQAGPPMHASIFTAAEACAGLVFEVDLRSGAVCDVGDIRLLAGCSLQVRAVDETGAPIAGAAIHFASSSGPPPANAAFEGPENHADSAAPYTDHQGLLRIDGLPIGATRVYLYSQGRCWAWSEVVDLAVGRTIDVGSLVLRPRPPDALLRLRITDELGVALPTTVRVMRGEEADQRIAEHSTDADGRLSIESLPGEPLDLWILPSAPPFLHGPLSCRGIVSTGREFQIEVPRNVIVPLDVRSSAGERILTFSARQELEYAWASGFTGGVTGDLDSGATSFPYLPVPFTLEIAAVGYRTEKREFRFGSPPQRVEIRLQPMAGIRGVVRSAGQPLAGARVRLLAALPEGEVAAHQGFASFCNAWPTRESTTDAQGHYQLDLERSGIWFVTATAPELARAIAGPLECDDECIESSVDFDLDVGGSIAGEVRAWVGATLAGVRVAASSGDGEVHWAELNSEGAYRLEHLRAGLWQVEVRRPVDTMRTREFDAGAPIPSNCVVRTGETSRHDFQLSPGSALHGRIRIGVQAGEELRAHIAQGADWAHASAILAEDGSFKLLGLDPGKHQLWIGSATQAFTWHGQLELRPGDNAWEWLPECGSVRTIVPPELRSIAWHLDLDDAAGGVVTLTVPIDSKGEAWLPWVPVGEYRVRGWPPDQLGGLKSVSNVHVRAGLTSAIDWN